ncbi:Protein CBG17523 [Caenorhabditis briggsae]|uniref:Protein CBG17523 n=1 Tax=Caenorhabditis briggsae TaxID=6238 RepID=A8XRD7_CAEBR|nr:Protein CBG17523 [Caenorhabditis briggsae]CAP35156.2 Protein CBG17523 [Caenorhabditis briggsae]
MVKRGPGRPRKDTNSNQGTSKGADSKRSRTSNIPDSEDDVQESRPRRKSARLVTYNKSDSDFENNMMKTRKGTTEEQKKQEMRTKESERIILKNKERFYMQ